MPASKRTAVILLFLLALILAACGGGTPATPISVPTPTSTPTPLQPTATTAPTATLAPRVSPTPAVTAKPPATPVLPPGQTIRWSDTNRGLTVGIFFDPYPPQLGATTTFGAVLTDAAGQPISDATIELAVTGGMQGMPGEHDESSNVTLQSQGGGLYMARASVGRSDLVLSGITLNIQRGEQGWSFVISKDDLPPR